MPESDPDRLEGASCTAALDIEAQTLTFEHRGWTASKEQKALSPLVVPLGAIEAVEYKWGRFTGWFRIMRRGQNDWLHSINTDPYGLTCGEDPRPFAQRVQAAVASAEPLTPDEVEAAEPVIDAAEADTEEVPSLGGKIAKGVGKGLVHGLFNNW